MDNEQHGVCLAGLQVAKQSKLSGNSAGGEIAMDEQMKVIASQWIRSFVLSLFIAAFISVPAFAAEKPIPISAMLQLVPSP